MLPGTRRGGRPKLLGPAITMPRVASPGCSPSSRPPGRTYAQTHALERGPLQWKLHAVGPILRERVMRPLRLSMIQLCGRLLPHGTPRGKLCKNAHIYNHRQYVLLQCPGY